MTYQERLRKYEQEKAKLVQQCLTAEEYQKAIKKIADKWRL